MSEDTFETSAKSTFCWLWLTYEGRKAHTAKDISAGIAKPAETTNVNIPNPTAAIAGILLTKSTNYSPVFLYNFPTPDQIFPTDYVPPTNAAKGVATTAKAVDTTDKAAQATVLAAAHIPLKKELQKPYFFFYY